MGLLAGLAGKAVGVKTNLLTDMGVSPLLGLAGKGLGGLLGHPSASGIGVPSSPSAGPGIAQAGGGAKTLLGQ